jgi:hypothetical protein
MASFRQKRLQYLWGRPQACARPQVGLVPPSTQPEDRAALSPEPATVIALIPDP